MGYRNSESWKMQNSLCEVTIRFGEEEKIQTKMRKPFISSDVTQRHLEDLNEATIWVKSF